MNVAVAVQHHPARASLLPRLLSGLDGLRVEVVTDPTPDGAPSAWRTYRECLHQCPDWATHLLVLQDDATVCPSFAEHVSAAVAQLPDDMISLFTGYYPMDTAIAATQMLENQGGGWVEARKSGYIFPTVALVWPRVRIGEALDFMERVPWYAEVLADDERLARWSLQDGIPLWHVVPNPVQHPDDTPSLIPGQKSRPWRTSCVPMECFPKVTPDPPAATVSLSA